MFQSDRPVWGLSLLDAHIQLSCTHGMYVKELCGGERPESSLTERLTRCLIDKKNFHGGGGVSQANSVAYLKNYYRQSTGG